MINWMVEAWGKSGHASTSFPDLSFMNWEGKYFQEKSPEWGLARVQALGSLEGQPKYANWITFASKLIVYATAVVQFLPSEKRSVILMKILPSKIVTGKSL